MLNHDYGKKKDEDLADEDFEVGKFVKCYGRVVHVA